MMRLGSSDNDTAGVFWAVCSVEVWSDDVRKADLANAIIMIRKKGQKAFAPDEESHLWVNLDVARICSDG